MLKVVQLEELIHVRHSVFVIGNAGTGNVLFLYVRYLLHSLVSGCCKYHMFQLIFCR